MGSYVSRYECEAHHNVTLNCTIDYTDSTNTSFFAIGDIEKGGFEGDPDIAGVGIFATFLAVSGTALACSILDLGYRFYKWAQKVRKRKEKRKGRVKLPGLNDFLEAIVQSCSDTQVFTGAAYAITLRYFRGCTITAYHYNLVANMMLLTCATHLMSVTIIKDYWKYPWLAFLRVLATGGVFLVTGLLLANQNADMSDLKFPTELPKANETDTLLFMSAACFQSHDAQLLGTLNSSFASAEGFGSAILDSKPGNKIEGWDKYLVMLLWYGAAVVVEVFCFSRRGAKRGGKRSKVTNAVTRGIHGFARTFFPCCVRREKKKSQPVEYTPLGSPTPFESKQLGSPPLDATRVSPVSSSPAYHPLGQPKEDGSIDVEHEEIILFSWFRKTGKFIHSFYLFGGVGICSWGLVESGTYMMRLRQWVFDSGWMTVDEFGVYPEDDATTFGQLVPICMTGLIVFTFFEMLSRLVSKRKDQKNYENFRQSVEAGQNTVYRPSMGNISEAFESTRPESTRPGSTRPELRYSKLHSSSISSPPVGFSPDTPTPFSDNSTLLQFGSNSSEVATPQPAASSDTGVLGTPLGVVPERISTPQPTASLGEMISEVSMSPPDPASETSQPLSPSRESTPRPTNNSFGTSPPRPVSAMSTTEDQAQSSSTPESGNTGVITSSNDPPRTPSPMTPTQPPSHPATSPPASERQ